jgi:hypothetical protein
MKRLLMLASIIMTVNAHGQDAQTPKRGEPIQQIRIVSPRIENPGWIVQPQAMTCIAVPQPRHEAGRYVFDREDLKHMPYTDINDVVATVGGVYQRQRGADVQIYGARGGDNTYLLDGMMMR